MLWCVVARRGVVLCGVVGWVSTLGVYCGFLLYDGSAGMMVTSLFFSFSRVCTRALSRATHAPPARNTPSSSTVFPHTTAACSETATDPVTRKDHISKHPDPLRERRPSKRRRSAPPCRTASCRPAAAKPCLSPTLHLAHGQGGCGGRTAEAAGARAFFRACLMSSR